MNANVCSRVFSLGQSYTAVGDNGLTAKFSFDPKAEKVFTDISVEISLKNQVLDFNLSGTQVIEGQNQEGLRVLLLSGRTPYFFDESSKSWTETVARNASLGIVVVLEKNGFDIKEVIVSLNK